MDAKLQSLLTAAWSRLPSDIRSPTATEQQLSDFELSFGPIPKEFRWFLQTLGGGPVGAEWVDDIASLPESHRKFLSECGVNGWKIVDFFIIGWDGGGNPFGIHKLTGQVLTEDHDYGGIHELAPSFLEFLAKRINC